MNIPLRFQTSTKGIIDQGLLLVFLSKHWRVKAWAGALLIAVLVIPILSHASDELSPEEIRQLSQQGLIKPLLQVLQQHQFAGTLLDVELEREKGRLIYEMEFLNASGEVWEYELDAETGAILKSKLEEKKHSKVRTQLETKEQSSDE